VRTGCPAGSPRPCVSRVVRQVQGGISGGSASARGAARFGLIAKRDAADIPEIESSSSSCPLPLALPLPPARPPLYAIGAPIGSLARIREATSGTPCMHAHSEGQPDAYVYIPDINCGRSVRGRYKYSYDKSGISTSGIELQMTLARSLARLRLLARSHEPRRQIAGASMCAYI